MCTVITTAPGYVNRILVDDICGAMLAAASSDQLRHTTGRGVFNLVDDDPAPRQSVIVEAQRLLGLDKVLGVRNSFWDKMDVCLAMIARQIASTRECKIRRSSRVSVTVVNTRTNCEYNQESKKAEHNFP